MFKTWRNLQYYHTADLKIYGGWSKSTEHLLKRLASVFIFVGNVFILLFPINIKHSNYEPLKLKSGVSKIN